jgi:glutamyl-tRNA reductase
LVLNKAYFRINKYNRVNSSLFKDPYDFLVIGSNFTKADALIRSRLAITKSKLEAIYHEAKRIGLNDFLVLSTCNRTEFYSTTSEQALKKFVVEILNLKKEEFETYFYTYNNTEAIRHFFKVTAGLDSQIIGDYEIVGQVKEAMQLARHSSLVGTVLDRISNFAFQASKEIKVKTNLSSGKYSVSYATAELISAQCKGCRSLLVVGTGEMGQAVARNLKTYFPEKKLALTNRTQSHSESLAVELQAEVILFNELTQRIHEFDSIITTAEADHYLIKSKDIPANHSGLFLDLSIPQVIDPTIKKITTLKHYSVDEISAFHNELMKQRHLEIPKAELIIEDFISKLKEWQSVFQHTGIIMGYKEKMAHIIRNGGHPRAKIEKSFSGLMRQIKIEGYRGCMVIQTMSELMAEEK